MILDKVDAVFIHVPKTGGSSITAALQHLSSESVDYEGRGNSLLTGKHSRALRMREHYPTHFMFAVKRSPWTRIISSYFYLKGINHPNTKGFNNVSDWLQNQNRRLIQVPIWHWVSDGQRLIVDRLLSYENLQSDFYSLICEKEWGDGWLPHNNASGWSGDVRDHFTRQAIRVVREVFADDFKHLDYDPGTMQ